MYLITSRHATLGRPLAQVLNEALGAARHVPGPSGQPWRIAVQLRDKDLSGREAWTHAEQLRALTSAHGAAFFVNGRVDVALAVGADGVHLGQGALPIAMVRELAPELKVAVSTHAVAELRAAREGGADFGVYGPVFATPSKVGILPPTGLHALSQAALVGLPVLALGGLDAQNAESCLRSGAVGVAGIRLVLSAPSPAGAMVELLKALSRGVAPVV